MTSVKHHACTRIPRSQEPRTLQITVLDHDSLRVSVPTAAQRAALAPELTLAERDVIALALVGFTNLHIARHRGSGLRTVANQLASAYRKLGLSGRRELAARAP